MIEIGLAGAMGAGKTTVADLLVQEHRYTRLSFADPIRYLSCTLLGRPINKQTDRSAMQRIGRSARSPEWQGIDTPFEEARAGRVAKLAEFIFPGADAAQKAHLERILYQERYAYNWGRPDYWIQRWTLEYRRSAGPVVVDDCRFPEEGEFLARLGFFSVRLDVPLEERKRRIIQRDGAWDPAWSDDPTEKNVDKIPVHLSVDGTKKPEVIAELIYQEALSWAAKHQTRPLK
jgi:ribosomal protein S16